MTIDETAAALVDKGYNMDLINKDGHTALHLAFDKDRHRTARVLIERGAKDALLEAAAQKIWYNSGYDRKTRDTLRLIPIQSEAQAEKEFLMLLRLDEIAEDKGFKGPSKNQVAAQVTAIDDDWNTVLMKIAKAGHDWPTAAAKLIEKGCVVNARNRDGETALRIAKVYKRRKTEVQEEHVDIS